MTSPHSMVPTMLVPPNAPQCDSAFSFCAGSHHAGPNVGTVELRCGLIPNYLIPRKGRYSRIVTVITQCACVYPSMTRNE